MQTVLTNWTALAQTGSVLVRVTDTTGQQVVASLGNFTLGPLAVGSLDFALPGSLAPGQYGLTVFLVMNGLTNQMVSGTYQVAIPVPTLAVGPTNGFSGAGFSFVLSGPQGSNYIIEASNDLRLWSPTAFLAPGTMPYVFFDPGATNQNARFYRAVMQ